jgi:hypothetical protein
VTAAEHQGAGAVEGGKERHTVRRHETLHERQAAEQQQEECQRHKSCAARDRRVRRRLRRGRGHPAAQCQPEKSAGGDHRDLVRLRAQPQRKCQGTDRDEGAGAIRAQRACHSQQRQGKPAKLRVPSRLEAS